MLWIVAGALSFFATAHELVGRPSVPVDFFTGVLAFDAILLAVIGLSIPTGPKSRPLISHERSASFLVIVVLVSALFSLIALLNVGPGASGLSYNGYGISSFGSVFSTGLTLGFLILSAVIAFLKPPAALPEPSK